MNIIELIDKLHNRTISSAELKELYKSLQQNDKQLANLINEEWKKSSDKGVDADYIKLLFNDLEKRLDISSDTKNKVTQTNIFNKGKIFIIKYLKYAVVLVIGFLTAWLFFSRKQTSLITDSYSTVKVENGSKSTINLPDGSIIHLNSGSQLSYPVSFGSEDRSVMLEGEGFFEVVKKTEKPFYVKTRQIIVKALGTSFNVKSYPDDDITETTLISGKVEIYQNKSNQLPNEESVKLAVLNPSEIATISNNKVLIDKTTRNKKINVKKKALKPKIVIEKKVKPELYTEWKNEILVFNNEKFADIIKKLERWYNVNILLEYKDLSPIRFSGKFDRESIQDVMDALILIQPFYYLIDKNKITIYKKNPDN